MPTVEPISVASVKDDNNLARRPSLAGTDHLDDTAQRARCTCCTTTTHCRHHLARSSTVTEYIPAEIIPTCNLHDRPITAYSQLCLQRSITCLRQTFF